jgi:hypothetical protein
LVDDGAARNRRHDPEYHAAGTWLPRPTAADVGPIAGALVLLTMAAHFILGL